VKRTSSADADAAVQSLVALSTLVAAEQTLHLLEQIVPDGKRRSAEVRALAPAAAEARLEELRWRLEEQL